MRYFAIFILLNLFGCSSDENPEIVKCQIQNTHYTFLELFEDEYGSILNNATSTGLVNFSYDGNNVVRTNGGLAFIHPSTGFRFVFVDNVYDSITHKPNSIEIYKKSPDQLFNNDIKFELNNSSLPYKKITSSESFTFNYSDDQLVSSVDLNGVESTYSYENENLIKVESLLTLSDGTIYERIIHSFEEYDIKPNPFEGLFYIRGAFYRSLSKNNYKIHHFIHEKSLGNNEWQPIESFNISLDFEYDENDYPKFGQYICN